MPDILVRLVNRDVLVGESDRSATEIIQSTEPVVLKSASFVYPRNHSSDSAGALGHHSEIPIDRAAIAFVIDL